MERYKIAFLGCKLWGWGGGIDYLCQIVSSYAYLAHYTDEMEIEMVVIMPYADSLTEDDKIRENVLISNLLEIEPSIRICYLNKNESLKERIILIQPDIVMPYCGGAFRNMPIPYISYIPDFQEEYYREFFSPIEILRRRQNNEFILSCAPYVIATSKSVASDIKKFYPRSSSHIFVQPFAPLSCRKLWDTSNVDLAKYKLPSQYFIISNQFWMHKDHLTAFRAIKLLLESGYKDICLVCTGKMDDYRDRDYFEKLKKFIISNSLESHIKLLGYIPKHEQIEIMKNAVALIQPTRFEGDPGGCSVYEAISYGKSVIMSDIPVNLEAYETNSVYYFKVGVYQELAVQMKKILGMEYKPYNIEIVQKIYGKNAETITGFYKDIIRFAVKG